MADDGTVFFTTAETWSRPIVNGARDVYAFAPASSVVVAWSQGTPARFLDATPDGKSVFFATNDRIVATDNDKAVDVYMTREGAGFPYSAPVVEAPCSGGDCRDPFGAGRRGGVVGRIAGFSGRATSPSAPAKVSVSRVKAVIGSVGALRVRVPGRGRVTTSGAGCAAPMWPPSGPGP